MTDRVHVPVMLEEVLELLQLEADRSMADLTLGAAGHAHRCLEAMSPNGRLFGFDQDPAILEIARERLEPFGDRVRFIESNFDDAAKWLAKEKCGPLDGALLDAGCSSLQLDDASRGFSFQTDGPLDMRMSPRIKRSAAVVLANDKVEELERIFKEYGEEPRARAIARKIGEVRKRTRLKRTKELAELVRSVTGSGGRIHPATRVFQGLRIAVNGELEALAKAVETIPDRLAPGGRFVVISFHSLEDRLVKRGFKSWAEEGSHRVVTRRPLRPTAEECRANPRSRSARLRCLERTGDD